MIVKSHVPGQSETTLQRVYGRLSTHLI